MCQSRTGQGVAGPAGREPSPKAPERVRDERGKLGKSRRSSQPEGERKARARARGARGARRERREAPPRSAAVPPRLALAGPSSAMPLTFSPRLLVSCADSSLERRSSFSDCNRRSRSRNSTGDRANPNTSVHLHVYAMHVLRFTRGREDAAARHVRRLTGQPERFAAGEFYLGADSLTAA